MDLATIPRRRLSWAKAPYLHSKTRGVAWDIPYIAQALADFVSADSPQQFSRFFEAVRVWDSAACEHTYLVKKFEFNFRRAETFILYTDTLLHALNIIPAGKAGVPEVAAIKSGTIGAIIVPMALADKLASLAQPESIADPCLARSPDSNPHRPLIDHEATLRFWRVHLISSRDALAELPPETDYTILKFGPKETKAKTLYDNFGSLVLIVRIFLATGETDLTESVVRVWLEKDNGKFFSNDMWQQSLAELHANVVDISGPLLLALTFWGPAALAIYPLTDNASFKRWRIISSWLRGSNTHLRLHSILATIDHHFWRAVLRCALGLEVIETALAAFFQLPQLQEVCSTESVPTEHLLDAFASTHIAPPTPVPVPPPPPLAPSPVKPALPVPKILASKGKAPGQSQAFSGHLRRSEPEPIHLSLMPYTLSETPAFQFSLAYLEPVLPKLEEGADNIPGLYAFPHDFELGGDENMANTSPTSPSDELSKPRTQSLDDNPSVLWYRKRGQMEDPATEGPNSPSPSKKARTHASDDVHVADNTAEQEVALLLRADVGVFTGVENLTVQTEKGTRGNDEPPAAAMPAQSAPEREADVHMELPKHSEGTHSGKAPSQPPAKDVAQKNKSEQQQPSRKSQRLAKEADNASASANDPTPPTPARPTASQKKKKHSSKPKSAESRDDDNQPDDDPWLLLVDEAPSVPPALVDNPDPRKKIRPEVMYGLAPALDSQNFEFYRVSEEGLSPDNIVFKRDFFQWRSFEKTTADGTLLEEYFHSQPTVDVDGTNMPLHTLPSAQDPNATPGPIVSSIHVVHAENLNKYSAETRKKIFRDRCILAVGANPDDRDADRYDFTKSGLEALGDPFRVTSIQDLGARKAAGATSPISGQPIDLVKCRAARMKLEQGLNNPNTELDKANALNLLSNSTGDVASPMPVRRWNEFSSNEVALQVLRYPARDLPHFPQPWQELRWAIAALKWALTGKHVDVLATLVMVVRGQKLWLIGRRKFDIPPPHDLRGNTRSRHAFRNFGTTDSTEYFEYEIVHLDNTTILLMPPSAVHVVITSEDSIAIGAHMAPACHAERLVDSVNHNTFTSDVTTNVDHAPARRLLLRLWIFTADRLVGPRTHTEHLPVLTEHQGILDLLALRSFVILYLAIDPAHYQTDEHRLVVGKDVWAEVRVCWDLVVELDKYIEENYDMVFNNNAPDNLPWTDQANCHVINMAESMLRYHRRAAAITGQRLPPAFAYAHYERNLADVLHHFGELQSEDPDALLNTFREGHPYLLSQARAGWDDDSQYPWLFLWDVDEPPHFILEEKPGRILHQE
ncbi:hypothetical protein B0H11DRAFT_1953928 [Mycena galericulata]|nr:hypothetical protein B0H11DRAFT_1953928 [Mycena galericulata]